MASFSASYRQAISYLKRDHTMHKITNLWQQLFNHPGRFNFFQAVRLIRKGNTDDIHFQSSANLKFAVSDIARIEKDKGQKKSIIKIMVNFMSVLAPIGILPMHYTETIMKQIRNNNPGWWQFINIFQHRAIALFYKAWEKNCIAVSYEQAVANKETDSYSKLLKSLVGDDVAKMGEAIKQAKLHYLAHFAKRQRSASSLSQLLSDYFATPIEILPIQGKWLVLNKNEQTALSLNHNRLGVDCVAGASIFHCQHKFRLLIGPVKCAQIQAFLPGSAIYKDLCQLICEFVGMHYQFDMQLQVDSETISPWQMSQSNSQLGWNLWLGNRPMQDFSKDIIINEEKL